MKFILNRKLKYYTKELLKYFNMIVIAFAIIITIILLKYKPIYKITISNQELGYVENRQAFEEKLKESVKQDKIKNIDSIDIKNNPQYELKLVSKNTDINEEKIVMAVKEDVIVTYKYYEIDLNNQIIDSVDTLEDANQLINKIKDENKGQELNLSILEKYTQNSEEVQTTEIHVAEANVQSKILQKIQEQKNQEQEEKRINSMPEINGIKLAYTPVTGTISSRYGSIESVRNQRVHSGTDIAAKTGTSIKAVASGTVTCSSYQSGYGNIVKINHGKGVETYYAHCSKLYVKQGQKVEAGEVIAAVGSTGNSTGPHLHFEIRVNGQTINPQKYLYN